MLIVQHTCQVLSRACIHASPAQPLDVPLASLPGVSAPAPPVTGRPTPGYPGTTGLHIADFACHETLDND
jgi:hypothetical protein